MGNLKVLETKDHVEYVWSYESAIQILNQLTSDRNPTKNQIYIELSKKCYVSSQAVKNWFTRKNGPGDIDQVKSLAETLGKPYELFLQPLRKENEPMNSFKEKTIPIFINNGGLNTATLKFIYMLNDLAERSNSGFLGFSKYRHDTKIDLSAGILFNDTDGPNYGKIVLDMCVDDQHHDIVSTYDQWIEESNYDIRVRIDESDDGENVYWIDVTGDDDLNIVIEDGRWYWA